MIDEPVNSAVSKKIFIDMDGTLADFYENEGCVNNYRKKGFFLSLQPYPEMIRAVAILMDRGVDTTVLSSVPVDAFGSVIEEKKQWLADVFRRIGKTPPPAAYVAGQSKSDYVIESCGSLDGKYLLDDFSVNLADFILNGGKGIKAYNGLNGRGWNNINWEGPGVCCSDPAERIADRICSIMGI